jgi:hypothetical protein
VADESSDPGRRQQCIDVLCGYLRLPYDPEHGSSHRTEHVTKFTRSETPITSVEEQVTHRLRQNDREVRQTIVRVICAHLQHNAENSWSHHDFDFTAVLFENVNFDRTMFSGEYTYFGGATFSGEYTSFGGATFSGERASFEYPHAWNNVTFDWDEKPAHMIPECVRPRDWPPTGCAPKRNRKACAILVATVQK